MCEGQSKIDQMIADARPSNYSDNGDTDWADRCEHCGCSKAEDTFNNMPLVTLAEVQAKEIIDLNMSIHAKEHKIKELRKRNEELLDCINHLKQQASLSL